MIALIADDEKKDVHNVPLATNPAAAEAVLLYLTSR